MEREYQAGNGWSSSPVMMIKRIRSIVVISLLAVIVALSCRDAGAEGHRYAAVYLDPHYGGRENGPILDKKNKGKDVTLALAKAIHRELLNNKVETFLSRDEDVFIPSGDRWFFAKKKGADVYISLRLKFQTRECVQLYYGKRDQQDRRSKANNNTAKTPADPRDGVIVAESLRLSAVITDRLKSNDIASCGTVQAKKDVLFETADFPAVIIEFGVVRARNRQSYVVDPAKVDIIAKSIAVAVKEFMAAQPH